MIIHELLELLDIIKERIAQPQFIYFSNELKDPKFFFYISPSISDGKNRHVSNTWVANDVVLIPIPMCVFNVWLVVLAFALFSYYI